MLDLKYKIIDESTSSEEDLYNAIFYKNGRKFLRLSYQFDYDDVDLEDDTSGFSLEFLDITLNEVENQKLTNLVLSIGFDIDMGEDTFVIFTNHIEKEEFETFVENFKQVLLKFLEENK